MKKVKWAISEQAIFLKRLGNLLQKGYSLLSALEFLRLQEKAVLQEEIKTCISRLQQGASLYEVFVQMKFHQDVLGYLFYAEKHGNIAATLEKAGRLLEGRQRQQEQLMKIIKYPLFLISFLSILLLFFNWILLPQFQSLFQSFHAESNSSISIIFGVLSIFPALIYLGFFLCILSVIFYYFYFRKLPPVQQMKIKLQIPYGKKIFRMLNTHYLSHQLGTLLQAGLSISDACTLMTKQNHHLFFKNEAEELRYALKQGYELDAIIRERVYYDTHFSFIIAHGLANSTLGKELCDYSDYILEKLEITLRKGMAVIQPIVYSSIAIVVVLIYVAMLMPMLEMITLI